jgi:hypothetical protein
MSRMSEPRVSELKRLGAIKQTGGRRKNESGIERNGLAYPRSTIAIDSARR